METVLFIIFFASAKKITIIYLIRSCTFCIEFWKNERVEKYFSIFLNKYTNLVSTKNHY